jgi:hypothetical protein
MFESVRVQRTDDPSCLLRINLVAFATTPTLQKISAALRQAWAKLVYFGFEASMIEQYRDATVMRFVTATENGGLCVTGEVIASSPAHEQLVLQYEEGFGFALRIKQR